MKSTQIYKTIFFLIIFSISIYSHKFAYANCPDGFKSPEKNFFDLNVCGDTNVSDIKLKHASIVLTNIIDYNRDGMPDNKFVLKELIDVDATLLVISDEKYAEKYHNDSNNDEFTVVFEDEIITEGNEFDPTLEEALHLVTQFGFVRVYPLDFGEDKYSKISEYMNIARGGYFAEIPNKYPSTAVYTYYDKTCDYACQITEFTYWVITSLRNQQIGDERKNEIKNEWKLYNREKIEKEFPELFVFFSKPKFGIIF